MFGAASAILDIETQAQFGDARKVVTLLYWIAKQKDMA